MRFITLSNIADLHLQVERPPFHPKLALLSRFLVAVCAMSVVIHPHYGWEDELSFAVSILAVPNLALTSTMTAWVVAWAVCAAILCGVAFFAFLGVAIIKRGSTPSRPLIFVLCALFGITNTFYVPIFRVLLALADCDYGEYNALPGKSTFFDFVCLQESWSVAGWIACVIVAAVFGVVAFVHAFAHPSDPHSLSIFHRAHSRIEAATVALDLCLVVSGILLRNYRVMFALGNLIVQAGLFASWIYMQPIYTQIVQDIQGAFAALPLWTAVCYLILVCGDTSSERQLGASLLAVAGLVPALVVGAVTSRVARKKVAMFGRRVLAKIKDEPSELVRAIEMHDPNAALGAVDSLKIIAIEVAARSVINDETEKDMLLACSLMRRGIICFPHSVYLRMQYCVYLLRARNQTEIAMAAIQACDKLQTSQDESLRLVLLRREAALQSRAKQLEAKGALGKTTEALNDVEVKQRLADATALYLKCQQLMSEAWNALQQDSVRQEKRRAKLLGKRIPQKQKRSEKEDDSQHHHHHRRSSSTNAGGKSSKKSNKIAPMPSNDAEAVTPYDANDGIARKSKKSKKNRVARFEGEDGDHHNAGDDVREGAVDDGAVKASASAIAAARMAEQSALLSHHSFSAVLASLERLREQERKADSAFEKLVEQCPDSPEVLQEYAQYLREVKLDDAAARDIEMRRDMAIVTKETAAKRELMAAASLSPRRHDDSSSAGGSSVSGDGSSVGSTSGAEDDGDDDSRVVSKGDTTGNQQERLGPLEDSGAEDLNSNSNTKSHVAARTRLAGMYGRRKSRDGHASGRNNSEDEGSHNSGSSSGLSAEQSAARDKQELIANVQERVSKLKMRLRLSTLMLLALASCLLWVFLQLAEDAETATTDTDFGGRRRYGCAEIAFRARSMHVAATEKNMDDFVESSKFLVSAAKEMAEINTELGRSRNIRFQRLRDFYDGSNVKIRQVRAPTSLAGGLGNIEEISVSPLVAMDKMIAAGLLIAGSNVSAFTSFNRSDASSFPELFFVVDNAPFIFRAMDTAAILNSMETRTIVTICIIAAGCLSGTALVVEALIVLGFLRPAVRNLFAELGQSIHRLAAIPRAERAAMASRYRAVREQAETEAMNLKMDARNRRLGSPQQPQPQQQRADNIITTPVVDISRKLVPDTRLAEADGVGKGVSSNSVDDDGERMVMGTLPTPSGGVLKRGSEENHTRNPKSSGDNTDDDIPSGALPGRVPRSRAPSTVRFAGDEDGSDCSDANSPKSRPIPLFQYPPPSSSAATSAGSAPVAVVAVHVTGIGASSEALRSVPNSPKLLAPDGRSPSPTLVHSDPDNFSVLQAFPSTLHVRPSTITPGSDEEQRVNVGEKNGNGFVIRNVGNGASKIARVYGADSSNHMVSTPTSMHVSALRHHGADAHGISGKRVVGGYTEEALVGNVVDAFRNGDHESDDSDAMEVDGEDGEKGEKKKRDGVAKEQQKKKKDSSISSKVTSLSRESTERRTSLERWYGVCLLLVGISLIIVFVTGVVSISQMTNAARAMNNVGRRRSMVRAMTWMTLELVNCYDSDAGMCGGVARIALNEDSLRCYLNELIVATKQVHQGDLLGDGGWEDAAAGALAQADWNTPCSILTDDQELYDYARNLGTGVVRGDARMANFMYVRGSCLASPDDMDGLDVLLSNRRTAPEIAKFSRSKCTFFDQQDRQVMLGLNRLFDDLMLNYQLIAYQTIMTENGPVVPRTSYQFLIKYTQQSEEWDLGMLKGSLLMEANVFELTDTIRNIVAIAFSVLVVVAFIQLSWLGSRVHRAIEDNMFVSLIVSRMLRSTTKMTMVVSAQQQQQQQHQPQQYLTSGPIFNN